MASIIKSLRIEIEGKIYQVIGGSFWEMLSEIKAIEGRRWDDSRKVWILSTLKKEEVVDLLPSNYQLLGNEDEAIEAEIEKVENLVKQIKSKKEIIAYVAEQLWKKAQIKMEVQQQLNLCQMQVWSILKNSRRFFAKTTTR